MFELNAEQGHARGEVGIQLAAPPGHSDKEVGPRLTESEKLSFDIGSYSNFANTSGRMRLLPTLCRM